MNTVSSLTSADIIGFVPTVSPQAAREFYEKILGLTFVSEDPFATVFRAGRTMIRVARVQSLTPAPFTILGWEVTDILKIASELTARGVTFLRIPGFPQDDLGIWTAPNGNKVAWFKDPDGNTLSISQH